MYLSKELNVLFKNLPADELWFVLFVRLLLDYLTFIKFLLSGSFRQAFSILKAHIEFFREVQILKHKRKSIFITDDYRKLNGVYKRSLFLDYFIFQKKTFSKIKIYF